MPFQQVITTQQPLGIVGSFYDGSLRRVTAGILSNEGEIGRVVTHDGEGRVMAGGGGRFAGILVNPKTLPRQTLEADLSVKAGAVVEYADKGRIIVAVSNGSAAVGARVAYHTQTGALVAYNAGLPSDYTPLENAEIFLGGEEDGSPLAVLQLN